MKNGFYIGKDDILLRVFECKYYYLDGLNSEQWTATRTLLLSINNESWFFIHF